MPIEAYAFGDGFTKEEAFELINSHVVRVEDKHIKQPNIEKTGFVAGLMTINDEVEIVIKFLGGIEQLTKSEFTAQMHLLDD